MTDQLLKQARRYADAMLTGLASPPRRSKVWWSCARRRRPCCNMPSRSRWSL